MTVVDFTPGSALFGGAMIGLAAAGLWWLIGRLAGVSSILGAAFELSWRETSWRLAFLAGLFLSGLIAIWLVPGKVQFDLQAVNITTGGGLSMTVEDRLKAPLVARPEMCSLNMGSMNFALFPLADRYKEWKFDWEKPYLANTDDYIFRNTFRDIARIIELLGDSGTRFEHECYDVGHLYNLAHFVDRGLVKPPFFVQLIFGILGGIGADMRNLMFMKETADRLFGDDYRWSVLGAGRNQMPFATQAAMMGGNVRVGLEDSLYAGPGKFATSNAEQVTKIRRIVEELGYEIASPADARDILGLKGGDKVSF
jgi:uncharacterized protein (DUF849 family)